MGIVADIIASVLAFFVSLLGSIMAYDICISADRTCTKIIRNAASRLAPFARESGEMEWLADLHDRETVHEKYRHAIGCFLVAGKMRRQAQTVMIEMRFHITGVGTVPLTVNMNSRILGPLFTKTLALKPAKIKKAAVIIGVLYLAIKFIRSAKASLAPGSKITREHLKQYKTWGYGAHIKRKGFDLNVGNIFRVMVLQFHRIQELIQKVNERLLPPESAGK
jgi:hypothetical protein